MAAPQFIAISDLLQIYDVFFLDAFGVLVDAKGALPGARALIERFEDLKKTYFILTNGSCFDLEHTALSYQKKGLPITKDKVISSGSLVKSWVKNRDLIGAKAFVVGPTSSHALMLEATLQPVPVLSIDDPVQVLVITNQNGFDFLPICDQVVSYLFQAMEQGVFPQLLLPNPDLMYPAEQGSFGFTSGAIALLIEEALRLRYGIKAPMFERLGKPFQPIFDEAKSRLKPQQKALMIGDQMLTDIKGAWDAGIDSALIGSGLTLFSHLPDFEQIGYWPNYLLKDLC